MVNLRSRKFFFALLPAYRPRVLAFALVTSAGLYAGIARASEVDPVQKYIDSLSDEQRAGQLMVVGFPNLRLDEGLRGFIRRHHFSNFIIFKRNLETARQIAELNFSLHRLGPSDFQPLIMVDQEGGEVSRIQLRPPPPSAMSLGLSGDQGLSYRAGEITGRILRHLGFNVNLAPVLDLADRESVSFIGNRSFGEDPELVRRFASAFSTGLETQKVLPIFKHFPGHGQTSADSHRRVPQRRGTLESFLGADLMPFQKLFEAHPQAGVMTAHVAFPDIDPTGQVATYSSLFLNDLLRTRWAFSGLIITDDLEMAGASSPGSIGERAVRAVEAGSDLVMVAWKESNQRQAHRALVSAIRSGRLSRSRVDMSLRRILEKRRTLAFEKPSIAPGFNAIIARSFNDMRGLTQELTRKRFAAEIQNRGSRAQISTGERVVVITGHRSFYNTFRSKWTTARLFPLSRSSIGNVVTAYAKWPGETFVYYVSGVQTARPLASLSAEDRARTMVVNATYPALIENPQEFKAVIHLATRNSQAGVWLAEALTSPALRAPTADKKEATAEP